MWYDLNARGKTEIHFWYEDVEDNLMVQPKKKKKEIRPLI